MFYFLKVTTLKTKSVCAKIKLNSIFANKNPLVIQNNIIHASDCRIKPVIFYAYINDTLIENHANKNLCQKDIKEP